MTNLSQETLGLLPHEARVVSSLLSSVSTDSRAARELYLEDITSREARVSKFQTSGKSAFEARELEHQLRILRGLADIGIKHGIVDYPNPEDPQIQLGSRVTILSDGYKDKYDVATHEIPGYEPDEVLAAVTPNTPIGAALLGRTVGDKVIWTRDTEVFNGTVISVDQNAQRLQFLEPRI
jgi:transcription elongation GreA/GreB family factor